MNIYITLGSLLGSGLLVYFLKLLLEKYLKTTEDGIASIHNKFDTTIPAIQTKLESMCETFKYLDFRYASKDELHKVQEKVTKMECDLALLKALLEKLEEGQKKDQTVV